MVQRHILSGYLIAGTLVLAGCSHDQQIGGFTPPPMPVEVAQVSQSVVTDRFDAVGTFEAVDAITVVSEIDAVVTGLPFHEGAATQKGELIAQLDDVQLQAELTRAEAIRDQRKATYDRVKGLAEEGAVAVQDYDDASAALKVAEADVVMIRARLAKTRIVAPFDGVVGARRVSPGAFLRAGQPITDLARLTELKVTFTAPERYYPELHRSAKAAVSTPAYPDYSLTGTIEVIEPVVNEATRSARIIAHVPNPHLRFRPGMSANVSVVLEERDQALTVPDEAVFAEGEQTLVFVVKPDSTVTRTPVALGSRQRQSVEVVNGLSSGMLVVKAGHQKLYEGARVMPILPEAMSLGGANAGGNQ